VITRSSEKVEKPRLEELKKSRARRTADTARTNGGDPARLDESGAQDQKNARKKGAHQSSSHQPRSWTRYRVRKKWTLLKKRDQHKEKRTQRQKNKKNQESEKIGKP